MKKVLRKKVWEFFKQNDVRVLCALIQKPPSRFWWGYKKVKVGIRTVSGIALSLKRARIGKKVFLFWIKMRTDLA